MSEHTPTPWFYEAADRGRLCNIKGAGETIARHVELTDASFIVRACNAYDDLVKEVAHWKALYKNEKRERERDEFRSQP